MRTFTSSTSENGHLVHEVNCRRAARAGGRRGRSRRIREREKERTGERRARRIGPGRELFSTTPTASSVRTEFSNAPRAASGTWPSRSSAQTDDFRVGVVLLRNVDLVALLQALRLLSRSQTVLRVWTVARSSVGFRLGATGEPSRLPSALSGTHRPVLAVAMLPVRRERPPRTTPDSDADSPPDDDVDSPPDSDAVASPVVERPLARDAHRDVLSLCDQFVPDVGRVAAR